MLEKLRNHRRWVLAGGLLVAGAAWSSPWDIDMVDARSFKTYEWKMRPPMPEGALQRQSGAMSRPSSNGAYQNDYITPVDRTKADGMVNPYPVDAKVLAQGAKSFQISCAPCHGVDGKGGGPVTHNDPANGINRFPVPAPLLSGDGAVTALRSDGYLYGTIRNGGVIMPRYGVSLTDHERWSIVAYMRTLDGGVYASPAPADSQTPVAPATPAAPTGGK